MELYYTGQNGVYNYGGKDYKYGDLLPSDIPKDTVDAFMAKGKMSHTRPSVAVAAPEVSEVELLKQQVTELQIQLTTAQQTITQLTEQLTAPPAAVKGGKK